MAVPATGPRGYHRLADLMGQYTEAAIFRRFSSANILNLLSLQSELIDLQVEFRDICVEDDMSTDLDERQFSTWFHKLRNSKTGAKNLQYQKLGEIRGKLAEYSKPECEEVDCNTGSDCYRHSVTTDRTIKSHARSG